MYFVSCFYQRTLVWLSIFAPLFANRPTTAPRPHLLATCRGTMSFYNVSSITHVHKNVYYRSSYKNCYRCYHSIYNWNSGRI